MQFYKPQTIQYKNTYQYFTQLEFTIHFKTEDIILYWGIKKG